MMRKTIVLFLTLVLICSLAIPAWAASRGYVFDDADLLTDIQEMQLNALAEEISEEYGCNLYIMTVDDYHRYGEEAGVFDVTWNLYHDYRLGYGSDRNGMILLLSMKERDYALFVYGERAEYAFNSYGQEQLEQVFLDNFGKNDWFGGFRDYLTTGSDYLARAKAGDPVRDNPMTLILLFVAIACFLAFVVTRILWNQMNNTKTKKNAQVYASAEGLNLTLCNDLFTHQTVTRRTVSRDSDSQAHSGGGGSGRSGKF